MKKVLLLFSAVLFLGCSDLSVSQEEAIKNELPADFKKSEYAEINVDVPQSQIAFKVKEMGVLDSAACAGFLNPNGEISPLAIDIYSNYLACPKTAWNANEKCPGVYGQVPAYNKPTVKNGDTTWKCVIGGCWSGGLDELTNTDCTDLETSIESSLCSGENLVLPKTLLSTMCKFILPNAKNIQEAENYLETFPYDSTLIERHYFLIGRNEGRPYKYCKDDEATDILRTLDLSLTIGSGGTKLPYFYDYGERVFCLKKDDGLIYLLK